MRQRLAIAATLLKRPELLILDEPNNGLDPAGIREVRDLMRGVADAGTTVLLSSHQLAEVQQVCDAVSIISRGQHVVTGPVTEVLAARDAHAVLVRVENLPYAAETLAESGLPVERHADHLVVSDIADPAWITQALARRRMYVSELTPVVPDLESVFLDLTGTRPVDGTPLQVGEVRDAPTPPPGGSPAGPLAGPSASPARPPGPAAPDGPTLPVDRRPAIAPTAPGEAR
jgi:ABC-2 type transport system ATP-binding protein